MLVENEDDDVNDDECVVLVEVDDAVKVVVLGRIEFPVDVVVVIVKLIVDVDVVELVVVCVELEMELSTNWLIVDDCNDDERVVLVEVGVLVVVLVIEIVVIDVCLIEVVDANVAKVLVEDEDDDVNDDESVVLVEVVVLVCIEFWVDVVVVKETFDIIVVVAVVHIEFVVFNVVDETTDEDGIVELQKGVDVKVVVLVAEIVVLDICLIELVDEVDEVWIFVKVARISVTDAESAVVAMVELVVLALVEV